MSIMPHLLAALVAFALSFAPPPPDEGAAAVRVDGVSWQRLADGPLGSWRACLSACECLIAAGDRAGAAEWLARARERSAPASETDRVDALLRAMPGAGR